MWMSELYCHSCINPIDPHRSHSKGIPSKDVTVKIHFVTSVCLSHAGWHQSRRGLNVTMVSVTAHAPKLHTGPICALFLFLYWPERVPLDLECVGRWEEEGGAAFTEGRGGGERFGFDGPLHRSLSPGRAVVNSSCSHIPGAFYQPCFLLCIKPPFVVKQNVLKKKKTLNKRLFSQSGRCDL